MSIKRLNIDERARYLIGVAVMRQILEAPRDPATVAEIDTVCRWIEHWLTAEELGAVSLGTGMIFDDDEIARSYNVSRWTISRLAT
ncbi:MAG: hypothetical protein ABSD08_17395 [Xanthobacteraceae bacterium]|jgi:hypothetical protein